MILPPCAIYMQQFSETGHLTHEFEGLSDNAQCGATGFYSGPQHSFHPYPCLSTWNRIPPKMCLDLIGQRRALLVETILHWGKKLIQMTLCS